MKKLLNKKGFTLMEMMIVIAIIVILVAIAVPSFTSSLDSANSATDAANLRAAKSAALIKANEANSDGNYYYDLSEGVLAKGDTTTDTTDFGSCDNHDEAYIKVVIENGKVKSVAWSEGGACKGQETAPSTQQQ